MIRFSPKLLVAGHAALFGTVALIATLMPRAGQPVAVLVSPWSDSERAVDVVAAAGGSVLANGRWGWIVIATSRDEDFVGALYRAGAAAVVAPQLLAGCLT